jgi:hypothetical protein
MAPEIFYLAPDLIHGLLSPYLQKRKKLPPELFSVLSTPAWDQHILQEDGTDQARPNP